MQLEAERQSLRHANGTIQTVQSFLPWAATSDESLPNAPPLQRRPHRRPASPESITDNEEHFAHPGSSVPSNYPVPSVRPDARRDQDLRRSHFRVQDTQVSNPITPDSLQRSLRGNRRRTARDASTAPRN